MSRYPSKEKKIKIIKMSFIRKSNSKNPLGMKTL